MRNAAQSLAILCFLPVMLPGAAQAAATSYVCSLTTWCVDARPCEEDPFPVWLGPLEGDWLMSSEGGERLFHRLGTEDGTLALAAAPQAGAVGLLTLLADGTMVLTLQALAPPGERISARGHCEAEQ